MIDSLRPKKVKEKQRRVFSPNSKREIYFDDYKFRDWDYRKKNKIIFLEGKFKKKVNISPKKEIKIYNNIRIYPQPNTKRTILSEYTTKEKSSGIKVNIQSFSQDKRKVVEGIKTDYKSNRETTDEIQPNKRHIKRAQFQEYKTTQITTLPGGVTRDINFIKDDKNDLNKIKEKKNKTMYFNNKLKNDYFSSVTCLPNSLTDNMKEKQIKRGKSYNYLKNNSKNDFIICGPKSKIKRKQNIEDKERPLSSSPCNNYNSFNYKDENKNYKIKKYKNAESYQNFDMLKPSSIFEKKYQIRMNN